METKKIGALVILGGIAILGYVYFKKNKPTIATSQSKGLEALSNYYKTGGGKEDTYIKGSAYTIPKAEGISLAQVDYTKLTPKEIEDLRKAIGTIPDPSTMVSSQVSQNLQGANFTNWDLGLNIKLK